MFQHTAARRRLTAATPKSVSCYLFQHTAARRRLDAATYGKQVAKLVSTHSRPKAAGLWLIHGKTVSACFNTQPPEGGWTQNAGRRLVRPCFNTQPPEGGWLLPSFNFPFRICFNTQPPEGGWATSTKASCISASSFNTQPPEGGWLARLPVPCVSSRFQHTAARRRLGHH